jgi:hypothetical protein
MYDEREIKRMSAAEQYKYYNSEEYKKIEKISRFSKTQQVLSTITEINEKEAKEVKFIDSEQRIRLAGLMAKAKVNVTDNQLSAFFYIISGSKYLCDRVSMIYNFETGEIDTNCLFDNTVDPLSEEWTLISLAVGLMERGFTLDLVGVLSELHDTNLQLALEALKVRFTPVNFISNPNI